MLYHRIRFNLRSHLSQGDIPWTLLSFLRMMVRFSILSFPYWVSKSVVIFQLREKGVIEQMRRRWWDHKSACPTDDDSKTKKKTSLDFMSLAGVYIILACGAVVSLFLLFIEVKYPGLCRRIEGSLRVGIFINITVN